MGKSKGKKVRNRCTPAGITMGKSTENLDNPKISSIEITISSLLDQLQVPDSEANLCGLRRLSEMFFKDDNNILSDPNKSVSRELQQRFIKSVAPFLTDPRPDIRNAAAGALRNVTVAGGSDICDTMVSNDIMTPLVALIQMYADGSEIVIQRREPSMEPDVTEMENIDTLLHAVHLLWNLCESNETAVKYFNSSNLLAVLLKYMDVSIGGIELAISVAQCLHTVSDDNVAVLSILKNYEEEIVKLIMMQNDEPHYLHLRTLATGLLFNMHESIPLKYLNSIFDVLNKVIGIDSRTEVCRFSSEVPVDKEALLSSDTVTTLEKLVIIVEAQTTAFEIFTNICSGEEEEDMDVESVNDSDEEDDSELSNMKQCNDVSVSVSYPLTINSDIREALTKLNLLENSYNKTNLPVNVSDILVNHTDTKGIVTKYQRLRSRAFHFLNNLVTILDQEELGSGDKLFKMWTEIGSMIINGENSTDIVESSTAALRSVLMKLVSIEHPQLCQITPSDLEVIFKIVQHCTDNSVCANITQTVGALGVFCANKNIDTLLMSIGRFLLTIAERQGPLWLIAEALDALMDVFAEDNTDKIANEISLVPHLSTVLPIFKRKVRAERKSLGDHYALITTANCNLARFITYKKQRLLNNHNGHC